MPILLGPTPDKFFKKQEQNHVKNKMQKLSFFFAEWLRFIKDFYPTNDPSCYPLSCGDGVLQPWEQCDGDEDGASCIMDGSTP